MHLDTVSSCLTALVALCLRADKTPNEYIQWRYAVGEDREALIKVTRQETAEDKAAKEKVHQIKGEDGTMLKLKVDKLLGRRKLKKDYEYEVSCRERRLQARCFWWGMCCLLRLCSCWCSAWLAFRGHVKHGLGVSWQLQV